MAKKRAKSPLSELENKVMAVVWERHEVTAEQVRGEFGKSQRLADSTIRTILRRLETKGYVAHRCEGRTYIYSPVVGSQNVAVDAVRSIIDRFCNGSVEALLVGMIDREVVSPEKLQELAARITESQEVSEVKSVKSSGVSQPSQGFKKSTTVKGS